MSRFFLIIAFLFGLTFCFVTPPFQSPDEFNHFYRSWQITEGVFLGVRTADNRLGGELPQSLVEISRPFQSLPFQPQNKVKFDTIFHFLIHPLQPNNRLFVDFSNTAIYAPTAYLPQVLAISMGKMCHFTPLSIFYLARIFTLIFWLSIVYTALKIVPTQFRWLFTTLALLPSSLLLHASVSADVVTNALSFLVLALFLKLIFGENKSSLGQNTEEVLIKAVTQSHRLNICSKNLNIQNTTFTKLLKFSKRDAQLVLLFIATLIISLNKLAYLPLCFLILISKQENFGGGFNKHLFAISLISANLIAVIWWASIVAPLHISYADYHPIFRIGQQLNEGVDPTAQVQFILHNPLTFSKIAIQSFAKTLPSTLIHYVGKFGWEKNYLPLALIIPLFFGLILRGLFFNKKMDLDAPESYKFTKIQWSFIAIGLLTSLSFAATMYLIWCPAGSPFIDNLAGKYFIPIAPLLFLALPKLRFFDTRKFDLAYAILLIISLLWSVWQILIRYYFL